MKELIVLITLLSQNAYSLNSVWYDAFNNCKKQSRQERDAKFSEKNSELKIERISTKDSDLWLEEISTQFPQSLKIIRLTIGAGFRSLNSCRKNSLPAVEIREAGLNFQSTYKRWYRAELHSNSCELSSMSIPEIKSLVIPNILFRETTNRPKVCRINLATGFNGSLLLVSCGSSEVTYFGDSLEGCQSFQREVLMPNLEHWQRDQFGWK